MSKDQKKAEHAVEREVVERVRKVFRNDRQVSNPEELFDAIFGHPNVKVMLDDDLLTKLAQTDGPFGPAPDVTPSGSRWPAFETAQDLKCLFCEATIRAVPAPLRGNRYRRQQWYTNGLQETARLFALCPKHQGPEHHEEAWRWARGEKDTVSIDGPPAAPLAHEGGALGVAGG